MMDIHTYCYPARQALSMFLPQIQQCVIDLAWVVESRAEPELPEHIIASVRFHHVSPALSEYVAAHCAKRKAAAPTAAAPNDNKTKYHTSFLPFCLLTRSCHPVFTALRCVLHRA
jgi:hypothetical protein